MNRYGKSSGPLLGHKQSFFANNDRLLDDSRRINQIYAAQPLRSNCKNCDHVVRDPDFVKLGVGYAVCDRCGHLNGVHEDTASFCRAVYTEDGGSAYASSYSVEDHRAYRQRVTDIYMPKAQFLKDALIEAGEEPESLRYIDLGAGSGYFVSALLELGAERVVGYEVSESQVATANAMIGEQLVRPSSLDEVVVLMESVQADVVSMIGVLEHLQQPRELLASLRRNIHLRYLYLSVPLFSPSVFFEMVFPTVMNRQLSGAHTHLYTESSLAWMAKEFDMTRVASWWFGTDMMDVFRDVMVRLGQQSETKGMVERWSEMFTPIIDNLQIQLDKQHLSSEVHMLLRING